MARDLDGDDPALAVLAIDRPGAAVTPGGGAVRSGMPGETASRDPASTAFDAPQPAPAHSQRRAAYRVPGAGPRSVQVEFRHPAFPAMQLALCVLDLSVDGCALLVPPDVPAVAPGITIHRACLRIGNDVPYDVSLRVQHLTSIEPGAPGAHLGCRFAGLAPASARALQRYVDWVQRRGRAFGGPAR